MTPNDRLDTLKRRIALYRGYLREGLDIALAQVYLREIRKAEVELAQVERQLPEGAPC